jgi:hypothetical protein
MIYITNATSPIKNVGVNVALHCSTLMFKEFLINATYFAFM